MGRKYADTASYASKHGECVRCPFFVRYGEKDDARSITCEGDVPDTRSKIIFESMTKRDFQRLTYCENQYTRCEHYLSVIHHRWPDEH